MNVFFRPRWRPWARLVPVGAALLVLQAVPRALAAAESDDEQEERICLPSRGTDPAAPPAVRLAGVYQPGNSGNMLGDMLQGMTAPMARYVPGTPNKATGASRWLFEGVGEAMAGRHDPAYQHFERCIADAVRSREGMVEAACRNNLGAVAAARGRYAESRRSLEAAAQLYRAELARLPSAQEQRRLKDAVAARMKAQVEAALPRRLQRDPDQAPSLSDIAVMREELMRLQMQMAQPDTKTHPEAVTLQNAALTGMAVRVGIELTALNQGNLAVALGQWEEAYNQFRTALAGHEGKSGCRPAALDELLRLRDRLPMKGEVTALVERYRRAVPASPEQANGFLFELGSIALAGSGTATAVAAAPAATPVPPGPARGTRRDVRTDQAGEADEVKLFAEPLAATSESALQALLAQAAGEESAGRAAQAHRSYTTAVLRAQAGGRAEVEAAAQAALMRLESDAGRPATAIFHGKRAANLLQELRNAGAPLERAARRTYLREREQTYSRLAQLLMQAQRLPEAERVLQMLKEDEGRQFIDTAAAASAGRVRLPETATEAAHRARFEQAALALRRSDDDRAAVAADRTYSLLLAFDRARLEKERLRAATELQELMQRRGTAAGAGTLEQGLRRLPREMQQGFMQMFADGGRRWATMLRELNEDAPRFQATPATPAQLAAVAEAARRADELRAALAPVLEALRREPAPSMAQMLDIDPATVSRQAAEQSRRQVEQLSSQLGQLGSAVASSQAAAQSGRQGMEQAVALTTEVYVAAAAGREDHEKLAQVEALMRGATPEALDGLAMYVRSQGAQMTAMSQAMAQAEAPAAAQAGAGQGPPQAKGMARLLEVLRAVGAGEGRAAAQARARPGAADAQAATGAPLPATAAAAARDAGALPRVQARLEGAVARARAAAGPSAMETAQARLAQSMSSKQQERQELGAVGVAEPLGRLWRIEQQRAALEARTLDTLPQSAVALESAREPLPVQPDDTATLLSRLQVPTALLYYLPNDTGVDVLLVHAQGRRHWRLPVPRAELERRIAAFNDVLRDATRDARPEAGALHDLLFAPVAEALAQSRAEVVALSLSGRLRFVPFAALHDGQRWLAERHAFAVYPGGPLADLLKPASGRWNVAAFGASQGGAGLPPLRAVPQELGMVVRQAPGAAGALPGRRWLDREFTALSLRGALTGEHQVVHIASHFKFQPGDAAASYLLLGDGQQLSLQALGGPDYRFDRTELVTLSACQTGLSADDAFGQEVDGLAALLMAQGAPSVLASLWQVADGSTALLMGTMYGLHGQRPLGRALALQQAQLAMIRGTPAAAGAAGAVVLAANESRGIGRAREALVDKGLPAGVGMHPYHWASFVLMGSWQ